MAALASRAAAAVLLSLLLQAAHISCVVARSDDGRAPSGDPPSAAPSNAHPTKKRRRRLGILTAGLPWTFGPYQSQSHELSLLLSHQYTTNDSAEEGYQVFWMTFAHQLEGIPRGEYSYEELRPHIPRVVPPPDDFVLDHLTFLGTSDEGGGGQRRQHLRASFLNQLAQRHKLDTIITLMDITRMEPDVPFALPVVGWVPLHSDGESVPRSTLDYFILRNYHGLAALAPSSRHAIDCSIGRAVQLGDSDNSTLALDEGNERRMGMVRQIFGQARVRFIPHIIHWKAIHEKAERGYALLQLHSLMDADAMLQHKPPLRGRGMEELDALQGSQVPGSERDRNNLFGAHRQDDFVVLLQGGNYDEHDRKGWDTSLQAFARFYKSRPVGERARVHMLIQSVENYLIESDSNNDEEAPPSILPKGHLHERNLHQLGIPRSAYTIDRNVHAAEVVAAYKKRADVCLHPSKVEGFGMNVLECQAVGTPVITTNHTAMGDFTRLGISVPVRQMVKFPQSPYWMATPDVGGIADALSTMYDAHKTRVAERKEGGSAANTGPNARAWRQQVEDTREWLDATFSPSTVAASFFDLLREAEDQYERRTRGMRQLVQGDRPPDAHAFRLLTGYHLDTADWDEPWTLIAPDGMAMLNEAEIHSLCWRVLLSQMQDASAEATSMMRIAATYEDGRNHMEVPPDEAPILVRTYILAGLQHQATKRKSLVQLIYSQMRNPQQLPEGLIGKSRLWVSLAALLIVQHCVGGGTVQQGFDASEFEREVETDGNYLVEVFAHTNEPLVIDMENRFDSTPEDDSDAFRKLRMPGTTQCVKRVAVSHGITSGLVGFRCHTRTSDVVGERTDEKRKGWSHHRLSMIVVEHLGLGLRNSSLVREYLKLEDGQNFEDVERFAWSTEDEAYVERRLKHIGGKGWERACFAKWSDSDHCVGCSKAWMNSPLF